MCRYVQCFMWSLPFLPLLCHECMSLVCPARWPGRCLNFHLDLLTVGKSKIIEAYHGHYMSLHVTTCHYMSLHVTTKQHKPAQNSTSLTQASLELSFELLEKSSKGIDMGAIFIRFVKSPGCVALEFITKVAWDSTALWAVDSCEILSTNRFGLVLESVWNGSTCAYINWKHHLKQPFLRQNVVVSWAVD